MKTMLVVLSILFLAGCVSAPRMPSSAYMLQEIHAGRMTVDDVNKIYDDHRAARAEYEQSGSYKLTIAAITPLLILGGAANGLPFGPGTHGYGYRGSGKVVINSVPTSGGGYRTTIDPMY